MTPEDRRLRALRPPKPPVDPRRPIDSLVEEERGPDGRRVRALTVFLAGAECPFTCVYCDLWRHTLDGPTPRGALPAQLRRALERHAADLGAETHLKLYNASNFFEPRAVPPGDEAELLELAAPFARLVVECHPRLVGERCLRVAERLGGRLQVAMGLETVHPEALARLNKKMGVEDFAAAAAKLRERGAGVRAFILLGAPFVPIGESVEWALRSARRALEMGVEQVALIPVRGGPGEMARLERESLFRPPRLAEIEEALERGLELAAEVNDELERGVLSLDTWDLERFARGEPRAAERIARLERMSLSGLVEPALAAEGALP